MILKRAILATALALAAAALIAGCGGDNGGTAATTEATGSAGKPQGPPLQAGFYGGDKIHYVLTDVSLQKDAKALSKATNYPVTFAPKLGNLDDPALSKIYLFMNGVKGPNPFGFQANVLNSAPGDPQYSPVWKVYAVTWSDGASARQLTSEEEILKAERAGELTIEKAPLVKNSPVVPPGQKPPLIGGFYDGEQVNYLLTDVSVEKDAKDLSKATGYPVNFAPKLGEASDSALSKLYLFMNGVEGPNPFGFQANVLDSAPGDPAYSPLWQVYAVTWSDGASARQLTSEEEILKAERAGELTIEETPLVKDSPVVGSG